MDEIYKTKSEVPLAVSSPHLIFLGKWPETVHNVQHTYSVTCISSHAHSNCIIQKRWFTFVPLTCLRRTLCWQQFWRYFGCLEQQLGQTEPAHWSRSPTLKRLAQSVKRAVCWPVASPAWTYRCCWAISISSYGAPTCGSCTRKPSGSVDVKVTLWVLVAQVLAVQEAMNSPQQCKPRHLIQRNGLSGRKVLVRWMLIWWKNRQINWGTLLKCAFKATSSCKWHTILLENYKNNTLNRSLNFECCCNCSPAICTIILISCSRFIFFSF